MLRSLTACALPALLVIALGACSKPEPPDTERPPEPQAAEQPAAERGPRHTQLRDAIQAPIDKARSVERTTLDAADRQRAEIDAQTDG
jgi:hypothetical protein